MYALSAAAAAAVIAVVAATVTAAEEQDEKNDDYPNAAVVIVIAEHNMTFLRAVDFVAICRRGDIFTELRIGFYLASEIYYAANRFSVTAAEWRLICQIRKTILTNFQREAAIIS